MEDAFAGNTIWNALNPKGITMPYRVIEMRGAAL